MRILGLNVLSPLLSFIGGFLAYTITLKLVWNETLGGDLNFVLFYGGIAFFLFGFPIYLGIIYFIDSKFHKYKGFLYPLGCMLIFFILTLVITLRFGSLNVFAPESMLLHSFFLTSGLIFGICHWALKKATFSRIPVSTFMLIAILLFVIWFLYEKFTSYPQPQDAITAIEEDLWFIEVSSSISDALIFYIKDQQHLGAAIVHESTFGWKTDELTWNLINVPRNWNFNKLNNYQKYGDHLIYGLIKISDISKIQITVNNHGASIALPAIPANIIKDFQNEDLYVWYVESETAIEEGEIKVIDRHSKELIDSIKF